MVNSLGPNSFTVSPIPTDIHTLSNLKKSQSGSCQGVMYQERGLLGSGPQPLVAIRLQAPLLLVLIARLVGTLDGRVLEHHCQRAGHVITKPTC